MCVFTLYVCCPFAWVWFYPNMYYACMCAFAIQRTATDHVCLPLHFPLILSCKALCVKLWDVRSGVWLRGDLRCSNIQGLGYLSFCGINLRWKRSTLQTPDKRRSYEWYRESASTCHTEAWSVINVDKMADFWGVFFDSLSGNSAHQRVTVILIPKMWTRMYPMDNLPTLLFIITTFKIFPGCFDC